MSRTICWSFSPVTPGQSVFIITCPRLIEALLSPCFRPDQPDEMGNYGPYIDAALAAADADEEPGIFRGTATGTPVPQDVPFEHALVTAEIDRGRDHTLTRPIFERSAKKLAAHYDSFPFQKPKPIKRGQSALGAMLEDTLGKDANLFADLLGEEDAPAEAATTFLGVVLPEDDAGSHLLCVVLNLVNRRIWIETELSLKRMQSYI